MKRKVFNTAVVLIILSTVHVDVFAIDILEDIEESEITSGTENKSVIPTIMAKLVINESNQTHPTENYVRLSPNGMSVRQANKEYEVIKNFTLNKVWLNNNKLKKTHEINIPFFEEYYPSQVKYFTSPGSVSNVLNSQVCADNDGVFKGQRVWRNQVVYEWDCLAEDGYLVDTQLYSDRWKMVVKAEASHYGQVELVDIVEMQDIYTVFTPNPTYTEVDFEEFITGKLSLDTYLP